MCKNIGGIVLYGSKKHIIMEIMNCDCMHLWVQKTNTSTRAANVPHRSTFFIGTPKYCPKVRLQILGTAFV